MLPYLSVIKRKDTTEYDVVLNFGETKDTEISAIKSTFADTLVFIYETYNSIVLEGSETLVLGLRTQNLPKIQRNILEFIVKVNNRTPVTTNLVDIEGRVLTFKNREKNI